MSMISRTMATGVAVAILAFSVPASAVPVTGDPQTNAFGWAPNSTNALNYTQLVPGREGQTVPYVLFSSNAVGSVTLEFFNLSNSRAFFEYRIDGIATGTTAHFVVIGDTIHNGVDVDNRSSLPPTVSYVLQLFNTAPGGYVDIRLALGGERDWDFDWVRFNAAPAPVPLPAAAWLLLSGLGGLGFVGRRRKAA